MRISVIGCGYLGAAHAAGMASLGHDVIDTDAAKVAALSSGRAPFFEPSTAGWAISGRWKKEPCSSGPVGVGQRSDASVAGSWFFEGKVFRTEIQNVQRPHVFP